MIVINLEKEHDRVPREVMWQILEEKRVPLNYINQLIKNMYDGAATSVITSGGNTVSFQSLQVCIKDQHKVHISLLK